MCKYCATLTIGRHYPKFTNGLHIFNRIQLFFKLFFVMGVTRVFEIVTWYESGPDLIWYWAVFDICKILWKLKHLINIKLDQH